MHLTPWMKLFAARISNVFLGRRRLSRRTGAGVPPRRDNSRALMFERLEERMLLSTLTVNSAADNVEADEVLTLREAIAVVNDGDCTDGVADLGRNLTAEEIAQIDLTNPLGTADEIRFDGTAVHNGSPIVLGGQLSITRDLLVIGNGQDSTIIDGNRSGRLFDVSGPAIDATFDQLTLRNGSVLDDNGGAIRFSTTTGSLTITNSKLSDNYSYFGGAVHARGGTVQISNSGFYNNSVEFWGGAVYLRYATASIVDSAFHGNRTHEGHGGAVHVESGSLTITRSSLVDNRVDGNGGAINAYLADVELNESTVAGNSSTNEGGGIEFAVGSLTVNNSTISSNSAAYGGGIFASSGTVQISGSVLNDNESEDSGGAIFSMAADVTLERSTVTGNDSGESGGGVYSRSNVTVNRSTISDNSADGGSGGAIYSAYGWVRVQNSTLSNNYAREDGGAIKNWDNDLTIINSTIHDNRSDQDGGGISITSGRITLINSTISGNSALGKGGGVSTYRSHIDVTNSTVTGNSAERGGGIYTYYADVFIENSIVAGNSASVAASDVYHDGRLALNVQHSLIGDMTGTSLTEAQTADINGNLIGNSAGAGVIDPQLAPLAYNGGSVQTHALLASSAAIDAGDNTLAVDIADSDAPLLSDGRGFPFARIANSTVDMGAYEAQSFAASQFVVDNATDELDGDLSDGDRSLREVIALANATAGVDTITFAAGLDAVLQQLTLGQILITDSVIIQGSGQTQTIIDGNHADRIFDIHGSHPKDVIDVTLDGMTLQNGRTTTGAHVELYGPYFTFSPGSGGAIRKDGAGTLTITGSSLTGNRTTGSNSHGGAVLVNLGNLVISDSTITGNSTSGYFAFGGAIATLDANVEITGSDVTGNSTGSYYSYGGAIAVLNNVYGGYGPAPLGPLELPTFSIIDSDISDNHAGRDSYGGGGAIIALHADISIAGSTLNDNSASGEGGALAAFRSRTTISDSTIKGNSAGSDGGGLYLVDGFGSDDVTIENCEISDNTAGDDGGGILVDDVSVTIRNTTVDGNEAFDGGGLFGDDAEVTLIDSTVSGNRAFDGGGIYGWEVKLTLRGSTVSGNLAENDGGGLYLTAHHAEDTMIVNSTISSNTAGSDGGGIYVDEGKLFLVNSTVTGNTAREGGGMYIDTGYDTVIYNSIVAGNISTWDNGPDIFNEGGSDLILRHSLLGSNDWTDLVEAQTPDGNGNLIGDPDGGGIIDPRLAPLADNGGPTKTHALLADSPARNAGSNALAADPSDGDSLLSGDQRGGLFTRIFGGTVDMGAFEAHPFVFHGDTAIVSGTDGNDFFVYRAVERQLAINGVSYQLPESVQFVRIDGGLGRDRLYVIGTPGNDFAVTRPGEIEFEYDASHAGYELTGVSLEVVVLEGNGGTDTAWLHDSAGNDRFLARPTSGVMFDAAGTYETNVYGFQMTGIASAGNDLVKFFDSPGNDRLVARPGMVSLEGPGFQHSAQNFDVLLARSLSGNDTAQLFGTDGDDAFYSRGGVAVMSGTGINFQLDSFETVIVSGQGGNDLVRFLGGAGADYLNARVDSAQFVSSGFVTHTTSFERLFANGGIDTNDVAILTDSVGNDHFAGVNNIGDLSGTGYFQRTTNFDTIRIRGVNGGINSRTLNGVLYQLIEQGSWV
ncbi:MAG: right-handed parallel beta-helix repeat-containing protein [Planctomycetaceae bacterium]|nr:right-handed parallel beta-helix repeat-containing protein [Planctomycetaceae bacterium]